MTRPKVLLNALHSTGGGGLVYLQSILPHLARDKRVDWTLLAPQTVLTRLDIPEGMRVAAAPRINFVTGHLYEQFWLPVWARAGGYAAMLCNANYVPLLARRPVPVLHTTAQAAGEAKGRRMRLYWWALEALTRVGLMRARACLAITPLLAREYLGERGMDRARLAPPGLPEATPRAPRKIKGRVISVGDFYAQKDYPTLLRAAALLHGRVGDLEVIIVGRPVDPAVVAEARRMIEDLGLRRVVQLAGLVSHAQLMEEIAEAEVLVSTSRAESFNMPLLEALALGTPVVCADLPVRPYVVGEAALTVPQGASPDLFAAAVEKVLKDDQLAAQLVAKGKAQAKQFSWVKTARVLTDTMLEVCA